MTAVTGELRLRDHTRDDVVVVEPHGRLDLGSYQRLRDHLLKVGADVPRAIVVDLTGLHVDPGGSLAVFTTVHTRLGQWPGVPVLLAARDRRSRDLVAASRVARFVPVHDTVAAAIEAVDAPPPRRVTGTQLANDLVSLRLARAFARHTCAQWCVSGIGGDVELLVCELVSNVVVHTACDPRLRLELRRGLLSVAVYDDEPGTVTLRDPVGATADVHGLVLVAQIATAWGCSPASGGGKVVWATLRTR
jgi:anti-anti-sigma regulatory factor